MKDALQAESYNQYNLRTEQPEHYTTYLAMADVLMRARAEGALQAAHGGSGRILR